MQAQQVDQRVAAVLNADIKEFLKQETNIETRQKAAMRINLTIKGITRNLKLEGDVHMFGSFRNGFQTGSSDLDVVFSRSDAAVESPAAALAKIAEVLPNYGYENVTKIFQANVPLVKVTDQRSSMEVDICINNELGVRNSALLFKYCEYDDRVVHVGRLVKEWAKRHELVGTADGCLNSYAYMLLTLHYLQWLNPPVVPNLQELAKESRPIKDSKWGCEDCWETKFVEDVKALPRSQNKQSVSELIVGFFRFFGSVFDWKLYAVCMRLNRPDGAIDKYTLATATNEEQWYIEDPFDLKHNLSGKCSRAGRKRILDAMRDTYAILESSGKWTEACPVLANDSFYLKCRISQAVTPQALLEEFDEFDLAKLHISKPDESNRMGQAFLEFSTSDARRRAHTKNEQYVDDCQLQLHYSSRPAFAEAITQGVHFSTYEMASYKMQRQVLAARVGNVNGLASVPPTLEAQPSQQALAFQDTSASAIAPPVPQPHLIPSDSMAHFAQPFVPLQPTFQGMPGRPPMQATNASYPSWDQHTASFVPRLPPPPPPPPPPHVDQGHSTQHEDVPVASGWPVGGSKGRKGGESKTPVAQQKTSLGSSNATQATSSRGKAELVLLASDYNRVNRLAVPIHNDTHEKHALSATDQDRLRSLLTFFGKYKHDGHKPTDHVYLNAPLQNAAPKHEYLFSPKESEMLRRVQGWIMNG